MYDLNITDISKLNSERSTPCVRLLKAVKKAIELAIAGEVDGTVTGPINRNQSMKPGIFAGHTEIYAHYTGTKKYAMLLRKIIM
jgi:4-hydroxythreonine-4-phosphate dehydrogenase